MSVGAVDNDSLRDEILRFLAERGGATRREVYEHLSPMLPESLTDAQRYDRISHLLRSLVSKGAIIRNGTSKVGVFRIRQGPDAPERSGNSPRFTVGIRWDYHKFTRKTAPFHRLHCIF